MFQSHRNQAIDLHSKLFDWLLYESNTGLCWVKTYSSKVTEVSATRLSLHYMLSLRGRSKVGQMGKWERTDEKGETKSDMGWRTSNQKGDVTHPNIF